GPRAVSGRAEPALGGAEPTARHGGALPGAEVQSELPRTAEPARGDGESHRGGAPAVQRGGPRVQHAPAHVPRQPGRPLRGLSAQGLLRGRARRGDAAESEVLGLLVAAVLALALVLPPAPTAHVN